MADRGALRDGPPEGGGPSRRCPTCGRRTASVDPGCPEHGPIGPGEASREAASSRPEELPSFGELRAARVLGRGGFGVVYEAVREADGARLAVKLARAEVAGAAHRLEREIEALRAIGPPTVPTVRGAGALDDGAMYVVMDLIAAPTLAARLAARPGPLPAPYFGAIAAAVTSAVAVVHARGRVHLDLKPENVLIDDLFRVTLIDFGLGSPAEDDGPGVAVGTTEYMSPEQCDGRPALDARADVYALGVLFYEMLAGRPPFWGAPPAVRESHRTRRPVPPSTLARVAPPVEDVVLRCLAKRPEDRFESARALHDALTAALAAARDVPPPSSATWAARLEAAAQGAAAAAAGAAAAATGRRRVGLVFLESTIDPVALRRRLLLLGGELAHAAGHRAAALFSHDVGDNPARRALRAADALVQEGIAGQALVDLAAVHVQTRRDGSKRYVGAIFGREDRYAAQGEGKGVLLTRAAAAVLSGGSPASGTERAWIRAESLRREGEDATLTEGTGVPLVGRGPLVEALLAGARAVAEGGPPTVVTVLGDLGCGKTSLAAAMRRRLAVRHPGAVLIALEAREPDAGGAGGTIGALLSRALDLPASAPPDAGEGLLRERLGARGGAALWPAVALALGWLPADAPALRALDAAPGALRSALVVAAGEALRARAAAAEACFVIMDDAHLADDATLSALDYAARAEARARLWIAAFGRPALAETRSGFGAEGAPSAARPGAPNVRPDWGERAGRRETYELGPLDPESAAALCRRLLLPVVDVPDAVVHRLVDRAAAVPLMLVELVSGLRRDGLVRQDAQGGALRLATDEIDRATDLPVLEWIAQRELDALAPALVAHARLVALLGDDVTVDEIASVLRALERRDGAADFPLDAGAGTGRLLTAGLLVRRAGDRVAFRHPLLRESVARGASDPLRRRVHHAAFEHHSAPGAAARLDRLAAHAAAADLREEAAGAYLALAEQARARHAYLDAEIAYGRALELATAPPLEARRGRGQMRYRLGRYTDALADFAAAREQAAAAGDVAAEVEILLDEATALDWIRDFQASAERVERARARADAPRSPLLEARLLLGAGRSHHRADREEEAADALERAAVLAAPLGDEGYETLVITLMMLGFILQGLGRMDDAARALDETIRRADERGDRLHLGSALNTRGLLRALRGDREGMIADLQRTISIGLELAQPTLELFGYYNLGEYLYLMDDLIHAAPNVQAAIRTATRQAGGQCPAVVSLLDARLRLYQGDEPAALEIVAGIRRQQEEARARGAPEGSVLAPSEEVLCDMVELSARDAAGPAWDELEARSARCSIGQEQIEVLEARAIAAARRGRLTEAAQQIEKAIRAAERIPSVMGARLAARRASILAAPPETLPPPG